MFDSGIKVNDLITGLKNEVDIALEIPDETYIEWLNSLQQLLYTEVIKEQKEYVRLAEFTATGGLGGTETTIYQPNPLFMSDIEIAEGENQPRFEDVYAVYADEEEIQLSKTTLTSGSIFVNTFFKNGDGIGYNTAETPVVLKIIYFVKPALVTIDNYTVANVMIPREFIDIVKSKLRGEAYKLANEDNLAAKWLNDYNVLLETFKAWITDKSPNFGV